MSDHTLQSQRDEARAGCAHDRVAALEQQVASLREALWAVRAGDGCICSGGPFWKDYAHSQRCRAWQAALTDEQRSVLASTGGDHG
jgi:hypothetical protein